MAAKRLGLIASFSVILVAVSILIAIKPSTFTETRSPQAGFVKQIIDPAGPRAPWGKSVGDINGDGMIDIIVGGHQRSEPSLWGRILRKLGKERSPAIQGELVWYQNPGWQKHLISNRFAVRTDLEVGDLNSDGHNDIAALTDSGLVIFWGPNWVTTVIDNIRLHDIELADFDHDQDLDLVARNQSLFKHNNGDKLFFYRQEESGSWQKIIMPIGHGEGLAQADMNADGLLDVVVNGYWLENPGILDASTHWQTHEYAVGWHWDDVFIDTSDFNGDGRLDVLLSPAEEVGQYYRISWFQAPADGGQWQQQVIDPKVEAVHHFVAAADVNKDGVIDVLTAEMNQGRAPNEIKAYLGQGDALGWTKTVLSDGAAHSMQILDVDGDSDIDVFGTHWQKKNYKGDYPIVLWVNQSIEQ